MSGEITPQVIENVAKTWQTTFREYFVKNPIPIPEAKSDITAVQLCDMETKIKTLRKEVDIIEGRLHPSDPNYKRLSEAIVTYSIKLDRINVIGRPEEKTRRRNMLIELDKISTHLIQKIDS